MMKDQIEEMEIEYSEDFDKNQKVTKELSHIKKLNLIIFLLPVFLVIFLTLNFSFQVWILGETILNAIIWSYCIPLCIYIVLSLLAHLFIRKINKKIKVGLNNHPINRKVILNNEGINIDATISSSILKWDFINKVVETNQLVTFYLAKFNCFWIPKIVLDEEQLRKMHRILLNNIDNTKVEFLSNDISIIEENK